MILGGSRRVKDIEKRGGVTGVMGWQPPPRDPVVLAAIPRMAPAAPFQALPVRAAAVVAPRSVPVMARLAPAELPVARSYQPPAPRYSSPVDTIIRDSLERQFYRNQLLRAKEYLDDVEFGVFPPRPRRPATPRRRKSTPRRRKSTPRRRRKSTPRQRK